MWIIENPEALKTLDWNPDDYVPIKDIEKEDGSLWTREDFDFHRKQHLEKFEKRNHCKLYGTALEEFRRRYQRNYMKERLKAIGNEDSTHTWSHSLQTHRDENLVLITTTKGGTLRESRFGKLYSDSGDDNE